jgi:hypothetical protein
MKTLARESFVLVGLCVADLASTLWLVSRGAAVEGNPAMGAFLSIGVVPFIAAKIALVALPLGILEWARRRQPEFVNSMLRLTIVLYIGVYGAGVWRLNADKARLAHADSTYEAAIEREAAIPVLVKLHETRRQIADGPAVLR